jgi:hypothetical protein
MSSRKDRVRGQRFSHFKSELCQSNIIFYNLQLFKKLKFFNKFFTEMSDNSSIAEEETPTEWTAADVSASNKLLTELRQKHVRKLEQAGIGECTSFVQAGQMLWESSLTERERQVS